MPVADVNFLVGENSSGKTSVLGILRLISSPDFWFKQSFDLDDIKFGHFDDIVSIHSKNRKYFRIGFIDHRPDSPNRSEKSQRGPNIKGFAATYRELEGLPRISRFTYIEDGNINTIYYSKNSLSYKSVKLSEEHSKNPVNLFKLWEMEHSSGQAGAKKIPLPKDFPLNRSTDIFFSRALIKETLLENESKEKKESQTFSFAIQSYLNQIVWIAPIRTQPRRTYDEVQLDYSPEGSHTPYIIRRILDSKKEANDFHIFMRRVGKSSGLFESIGIKRFGRGVTSPFEVDIVLDRKALNLNNVGYGVSQSLPVLVELLTRPKRTWFAVQQPEVHLHPRAQAALGDVLFELAARDQKRFLIETHSDYMIDRFRMNYRNRVRVPKSQVLFFERKNGNNTVFPIDINKAGELSRRQPRSYRKFFMDEQMKSLGI